MTNPWFKFYGGEYLSDPKMDALDGNERSIWMTILCLASQSGDGIVRYTTEEKLIEKAGVLSMYRKNYKGVLNRFEKLQMLEECNGNLTEGFKPKNWEKRQYSEGYLRVKRFREKDSNADGNDDVTDEITIEEKRVEESREEKKRIEKSNTAKFSPPTLEEVKAYCIERKNSINPSRFMNYYQSNGWMVGRYKMKDWKASVRTWEEKETPSVEQKTYQPKKK